MVRTLIWHPSRGRVQSTLQYFGLFWPPLPPRCNFVAFPKPPSKYYVAFYWPPPYNSSKENVVQFQLMYSIGCTNKCKYDIQYKWHIGAHLKALEILICLQGLNFMYTEVSFKLKLLSEKIISKVIIQICCCLSI